MGIIQKLTSTLFINLIFILTKESDHAHRLLVNMLVKRMGIINVVNTNGYLCENNSVGEDKRINDL